MPASPVVAAIPARPRLTGTNSGPLGDRPATNRAVDLQGASVLQIKRGKIAWLHGYYDRRAMLRQLGL